MEGSVCQMDMTRIDSRVCFGDFVLGPVLLELPGFLILMLRVVHPTALVNGCMRPML